MCYGQRGNTSYSWATAGNWLNANNTSQILDRLPTPEDNVYIYADILRWKPLVVEQDTVALTKEFAVGYATGSGRTILFEIQDGGTMTNSGDVVIGRYKSGDAGGIATVRSGGEWTANVGVTVGGAKNNRNLIMVEAGGRMTATNGEFIVGGVTNYCGTVTNRGTLAVKDFFSGGSGTGTVANEGTFTVANKFTIGRYGGSAGYFHQRSGTFVKTTTVQPLHVGYSGIGVFEVDTPLTLLYGEQVLMGANGGRGELIINAGGSVTGVQQVVVGAQGTGGVGAITLAGGEMVIVATNDYNFYALQLGKVDSSGAQVGWGTIRGYGTIGRTEIAETDAGVAVRVRLCGQVIADGGDLDLGLLKTVGKGGNDNACGTNGWYAVNKGRLIFPRRQNMFTEDHVCLGEYVYKGTSRNANDISLVNSIQLRLYKDGAQLSDNKYHFAMLYAADRDDIPGTLPCVAADGEKTLAVWRLGHFSDTRDVGANPLNPVAFDEVSLRFCYDNTDVDLELHKVVLYRYNGSAWERVGMASSSDPTHIATASNQPAYDGTAAGDNWNIGWYAIVRKKPSGMTLIIK